MSKHMGVLALATASLVLGCGSRLEPPSVSAEAHADVSRDGVNVGVSGSASPGLPNPGGPDSLARPTATIGVTPPGVPTPPPIPTPPGTNVVGTFGVGTVRSSGSGGGSIAIAPADELLLRPKLVALVTAEGRGVRVQGNPMAGTLRQGEAFEFPLGLEVGRCYTVVAVSAGGISELDAEILSQPIIAGSPPAVMAHDGMKGPDAIVGGQGKCWKFPMPIASQGTVVVKAVVGSGAVAVQVLIK